jgi:hypothetical protein
LPTRTILTSPKPLLAAVLFFATVATAQTIISRHPNVERIKRAWDSLGPQSQIWNQAMQHAGASLKPGFSEAERLKVVADLKVALEAGTKQNEAIKELLDELDLESDNKCDTQTAAGECSITPK